MHIIIIGAGEVGSSLAQRLSQEAKDVVVIDESGDRLRSIQELSDVQTIQGSGSSPAILRKAGIEDADMLIAVTDSDEVNLVACLLAQASYSSTIKIARIRNPEYYEASGILGTEALGIDLAINPEREAAEAIVKLLEIPSGATDMIDFAEGRVKLVGLVVSEGSPLAGVRLTKLRELNPNRHVLIAAIVRGESEVIIPKGDTELRAGDVFYSVTVADGVPELLELAGKTIDRIKRVMIVGGTNIGAILAGHFVRAGVHTKLLDRDERCCEQLAEAQRGLIVIHGDGTDVNLLAQAGIGEVDAFITCTHDEEDNILMALIAKRLGARRVVPLVNRTTYTPLVTALGVDIVVSPRSVAVSSILSYIRAGKVVSVRTLRNDIAEAVEFIALATSEIVGRPLAEIKFPRGSIVGAIVRGDTIIIPTGADRIEVDDRVIVFATREAVSKVEKKFTVKAEFF
ncbi:MAG: Trk system potassium transporter TrkA [Myxococcales bacterium]|nr:Trk system potassium transporter TrkA [Myxococcales bacterium]